MIAQATLEYTSTLPLEDALQELADRMRGDISPEPRARLMNLAGDLCFKALQRERALLYFDAAIDLYLSAGRFAASAAICEKLVRLKPDVIRARCTLAWLAIGKGIRSETEEEITDYVRAAQRAGKEGLASRQLVMMAEAATRIELRERLAEHLLEIGAEEDADRVLGAVFAERNGLRPPPPQDEGKLWAKLLRAALMGPQELKDQRPQTPEEGHDGEAAYLPSLGDQAESE